MEKRQGSVNKRFFSCRATASFQMGMGNVLPQALIYSLVSATTK